MCECEPFQLDASAANMFTHYSVSVYLLISYCCKKNTLREIQSDVIQRVVLITSICYVLLEGSRAREIFEQSGTRCNLRRMAWIGMMFQLNRALGKD